MKIKILAISAAQLLLTTLQANDIEVTNPSLIGTNTMDATTHVQFDITWANSWRTSGSPGNWDAAWVFVKYRDANTGLWQPARLGSDADHNAPVGTTIVTGLLTPSDEYDPATNWGVGAFIHRSVNGMGTFASTGLELRWNYGQNGIAYGDIAEVRIFAVEMVLVPQGSFFVGSGGSESSRFKDGNTNNPFQVTSESALEIGNVVGRLWAMGDIETTTLPAAFPKGFTGFYLMKYSITQQQYVDFLNTLTRIQQDTRTAADLSVGVVSVTNRFAMCNAAFVQSRNAIRCDAVIDANDPIIFYCDRNGNGTGGEANDGQCIACNFLSWSDVAAYLDWSGLRPMTELEYEKGCRGPIIPTPNEYAWGNANIRSGNYTVFGINTNTEGVSDPEIGDNGNAIYSSAGLPSNGPTRVGIFAGTGTSRVNAGAGYHGAMELSGNLWERSVTVGNVMGRTFDGTMGDGSLDPWGNADEATWPGTDAAGAGFRGGHWILGPAGLRVSDRSNSAIASDPRILSFGGRGVRSVP